MLKIKFLALLLLFTQLAQAQTPAQANKALFDKTVDELNFRTFETVYDKSFTRGKFPVTLRTAAARRQFDQFGDNAALKKLFQNYNASAEHYKTRFGTGPVTQGEFEKQLNGILRDRNFEFFIHGLPRDERVALVRAEERLIKQAGAQFNAAGAPADAAAVPTDAEGPVAAPLTTNDDARATPAAEGSESAAGAPAAAADDTAVATPQAEGPAPRHNWLDYLTFLLSLSSFLLLLHLVLNVIPGLQRRIDYLAPEGEPEPDAAPAPPARSLLSRLRDASPKPLRDDRYGDDDDEEEAPDSDVAPHRPGRE